MIYSNPVLSGFYPDPSICSDGNKFYLVNSTFQFFPGVTIFESEDLLNWKQIGHCLTKVSQLPLDNAHRSEGIFAPTIRYNDGYFFMITTNVSGGGNFLVYTDNIYGEWSEPVWLPGLQGIDPSLLFADGKCYFTGNGLDENGKSGIFLSEINPFTGQEYTKPVCIWHGNGGRYLEGPHLYKINNYYYIMAAEGGTEYGHMEIYARSTSPYGPFEGYSGNPFLTNRNLGGYEVQGVGHADLIQDKNGNYWLVHLAFRQTDRWMMHHITGRETYLVPVIFDADGWFTAGVDGTTLLKIETDDIPEDTVQPLDTVYTFENTDLYKEWITLRRECEGIEKIVNEGSTSYHMVGTEASINDGLGVPAFMAIRQKEMYGSIQCHVSLICGKAGISVYMDEQHHYDLMLIENGANTYGVLRVCIGDIIHNQCVVSLGDLKDARCRIELTPMNYIFEMIAGDKVISFGQLQTRYLSTEVTSGFTGVIAALFTEPGGEAFFADFLAEMKRDEMKRDEMKRDEISDSRITKTVPYVYKNCPIPGGGYVTGFLYHPTVENIMYARTDIGGVYRYDFDNENWISLVEHVKTTDIDETFPIAFAVDKDNPDLLYIVCGDDKKEQGLLCISNDRGESFRYENVPVKVHGNWPGRGTGYRLVVDPSDSNTLYFASQKSGLLRTGNLGKDWEKLSLPEDYLTFVFVSSDGNMIICGTCGYTSRLDDWQRGHGLYVSYDAGESFEKLEMPENCSIREAKMNGLVPSRYDFDGKYFYVTMNSTGLWNYIVDMGYSCDTGGLFDGRIIRYEIIDGRVTGFKDITPSIEGDYLKAKDENGKEYYRFGFGGICSSPERPGLLVCSSLCKECVDDDAVLRSFDYGETWEVVLQGLETGEIRFVSEYMKPKYNGQRSFIHWLSDMKINPFNPDEAWFNTGSGCFRSRNFTKETVIFTDDNKGLEETVHINVYAPCKGDIKLVDILGDLGGFAFRDLDTACDNSFADAEGNRYITCINADLSDTDGNIGIVTARGNWRGLTKGGLIVTKDGFKSFDRIPMFFGLSDKIDARMEDIERPNVNAGWVSMSHTGENIVWSIADGIELPCDCVISSQDGGTTFDKVKVYDFFGNSLENALFKTFSDRVRENVFYGFDDKGRFYVSEDAGVNFHEKKVVNALPAVNFGLIDTINKTGVIPVNGESGVFYISLSKEGLWKLVYDFDTQSATAKRLTAEGDHVYRAGLGIGRDGGDYITEPKAIYMCAGIEGKYGFFRTFDEGKSFELISNDKQHFGDINSIDGDKKVFGRFFIGTGTRGVKYGEIDNAYNN